MKLTRGKNVNEQIFEVLSEAAEKASCPIWDLEITMAVEDLQDEYGDSNTTVIISVEDSVTMWLEKVTVEDVAGLFSKQYDRNFLDVANYDGLVYNMLQQTGPNTARPLCTKMKGNMMEFIGAAVKDEGTLVYFYRGSKTSENRTVNVVKRLGTFGHQLISQIYDVKMYDTLETWVVKTDYVPTTGNPILILGPNLVQSIFNSINAIMTTLMETLYVKQKYPNGYKLGKTGVPYTEDEINTFIREINSINRKKRENENLVKAGYTREPDDLSEYERVLNKLKGLDLSRLCQKKSRVGGRKVTRLLSEEEFRNLIYSKSTCNEDDYDEDNEDDKLRCCCMDLLSLSKVKEDLSKISFDTENFIVEDIFIASKSKIPYVFFSSGGDWEIPIYGAIYWDGSKFRGYIPECGNVYNTETKECFGNTESITEDIKEHDGYNILKQLKIKHTLKNVESFNNIFEEIKYDIESSSIMAMEAIEDRLELCLPKNPKVEEF